MSIDFNSLSTWITLITTLFTGIGGCYLTIRQISNIRERAKKKQYSSILQAAKENDEDIKKDLENRIEDLETKFNNIQENINKDISHLKETYNSEIRFLGQKIEELRMEVHNQHGQLVALLTKMIGKD